METGYWEIVCNLISEGMVKDKYFEKFEASIPSLVGKVVVITGTTSGTGNVAARTALKKGAEVCMLNRSVEKAEKSLEDLFETLPDTRARAHFVKCDLSSFKSVEEAAAEIIAKFGDKGIDVLANNAGVMALPDVATEDGYDIQVQTNYLAHFMLTRLLFPLLEKSTEGRIVNHSSLYRLVPFTFLHRKYFEKRGGKLGGNGTGYLFGGRWLRYHQTKLADSVFTLELQRRLGKAHSTVSAYCAHPGIASTELISTSNKEGGIGMFILNFAQSPNDGAMGLLKCMFLPNLKKGGLYGPYLIAGKPGHRYHGVLSTASSGKMLWSASEEACGKFDIK